MANPNQSTPTPGKGQSDHKDYAGTDRTSQQQGQESDRDRKSQPNAGDAQNTAQNSERRDQNQQNPQDQRR